MNKRRKRSRKPKRGKGSVAISASDEAAEVSSKVSPEVVVAEPSQNRVYPPLLESFTPSDRWLFGGLLCSILMIYVYTLWPTVAGGDSGELVAAAYTWGVAHPPGYPLFVIVGKLLSYIPFGTVGWRINLVSALFSVAAAAFLYLALFRLTRNSIAAFVATGAMAFSPLVWRYSILAEVFTINNFFVCLLLYLFVKFQQERQYRTVYLAGFVFGLGLCNHHTLIFVGVPIGIWILIQDRRHFLQPVNFLKLFLISIAGLTPYLYLYISSLQAPLVGWGDMTTWDGFLRHLLRKEYGTFNLSSKGAFENQFLYGLWFYLKSASVHLMYLGWVLMVPAIYFIGDVQKRRERGFVLLLLFIPILYLLIFSALANLPFVSGDPIYKDVLSRFWIMPHLFWFLFVGLGVAWCMERFELQRNRAIAIALVVVLTQLGFNFTKESARNNYSFADYGKSLLRPLPEGALFFTINDININTVRYVQQCEGFRPDVKVLDLAMMTYDWLKRIQLKHYPDVVLPGVAYHATHPMGYNLKKLFDANYDQHPIYTGLIGKKGFDTGDQSHQSEYRLVPYGLSFKVERRSDPFNLDEYITESKNHLVEPYEAFPEQPPPHSWEEKIYKIYWNGPWWRAVEVLKHAEKIRDNQPYLKLGVELLEDLIERREARGEGPFAHYYKTIGIAYQNLSKSVSGSERTAYRNRMVESWEIYLDRAESTDSSTDRKIRKIVERHRQSNRLSD